MKRHKSYRYVFGMCSVAGLGGLVSGYAMSELAFLYNQMKLTFNISEDESSYYEIIMVTVMSVGALLSSFLSHRLIKIIGRRKFMMLSDIILIIGSSLGVIGNKTTFILARFLLGLAVGMNSVVIPMYIREMSPDSISGVTGSMFQVYLNLGIIFGILLCLIFIDNQNNSSSWRIIIIAPCLYAFLRLFFFLTLYKFDTPYFYYSKGQHSDGKQMLYRIYAEECVQDVEKEILLSLKQKNTDSIFNFREQFKPSEVVAFPDNVPSEQQIIQENASTYKCEDGNLNNVKVAQSVSDNDNLIRSSFFLEDNYPFEGKNYENQNSFEGEIQIVEQPKQHKQENLRIKSRKRRLIAGITLNILQQLTGINLVIQYSQNIFETSSKSWKVQNVLALLSNIYLLLAALIGCSLNREIGRKRFLFGGYFICGSINWLLAGSEFIGDEVSKRIIHTVLIFLFFGTFNCSVGPVTWIFTSDILKGKALSLSIAANWIGNTIVSISAQQSNYLWINFTIFGGFCFLASVYISGAMIETEGKSFKEIIKQYAYNKRAKKL